MQISCKFLCTFLDKAKKPNRMSKNMFDRNAKLKSSTPTVCMYTALITHQYVMQMGWKKLHLHES